jgi:hypothetical protein
LSGWSEAELAGIGQADELSIASYRRDGTLRPYVTIWVVRVGGDIFVRSAYGATNPWFARALRSGRGRIRAGGVEKNVEFGRPSASDQAGIDEAYHRKYDRYGQRIVSGVVGESVYDVTLSLIPVEEF